MSGDPIPLLWLCGPPGVGKTAVGWETFTQLTLAGIEACYVDIDQLGICYPAPASDPGRHLMKARNLGAVVASFRAAGARCVVVSGVVDADDGVLGDQIPNAVLSVCRLRTSRAELRRRFIGRGVEIHHIDEVLRAAEDMDASDFADASVDIDGVSVAEAARLVRQLTGGWPLLAGPNRSSEADELDGNVTAADGEILWLCGPTGVGKSTVGFAVYQTILRAGLTAAYIDLSQVGFCRAAPADDPGNHRVKARNLAAIWQTYREAGAQFLVVVGPVENQAARKVYADALPAATVKLCRLHAGRHELTRRIMLRGQGHGWSEPGDPLRGRSTSHLLRIAEKAGAAADILERAAIGDLRIETDGRTVEEAATMVLAQAEWPSGPNRRP